MIAQNGHHILNERGEGMIYADISYSKQLKDLFPESEWWWMHPWCITKKDFKDNKIKLILNKAKPYRQNTLKWVVKSWSEIVKPCYPALTTDMLLERLPRLFQRKYTHDGICTFYLTAGVGYDENDKDIWSAYYMNTQYSDEFTINAPSELYERNDKSLPNALSKMLLWLIKEGLV